LEILAWAIGREIEAHACEICDNGGVCDFFVQNEIALHRASGSYVPRVHEYIEEMLERDLSCLDPLRIVRSTEEDRCPSVARALGWGGGHPQG
jgi:hypothetical protein